MLNTCTKKDFIIKCERMKERIKYYARLYFEKIVPLSAGIAALTIVALVLIGKLNIVNYLDVLFVEASVAFIIAGVFSIIVLFTPMSKKVATSNSKGDLKVGFSLLFLIVGSTLILFMFIIHFVSKLFT